MKTKTGRALQFNELSDEAKQNAISEHREWLSECGDVSERIKEDIEESLSEDHGITGCDVNFSCGHCQSDYVSFSGRPEITLWAEHDEWLKTSLTSLSALFVLIGLEEPEFSITIADTRLSHSVYRPVLSLYLDYPAIGECDTDYSSELWGHIENIEKHLKDEVKRISRKLLEGAWETDMALSSDEWIIDSIEANECLFDKDGYPSL